MLHRLEGLATRWKMNLRIYDTVEVSEAESLHSSITIGHGDGNDTKGVTVKDNEVNMTNTYWQPCYAPQGPYGSAPSSISSSSVSSSASFEPGTSINNTVSSYSCNSSSPSSSTTNSSSITSHSPSIVGHDNAPIRYTHPLPTLYGIIISHTVVAVVAYDPNSTASYSSLSPASPSFTSLPNDPSSSLIPPCLRTISFFDLGDGSYDVWNALALAIVIVHCRNALLDLAHDGVLLDDVGTANSRKRGEEDEDEEMDLT